LHFAVDKGHHEVVKLIMQCDRFTEINRKDEVRQYILFYAMGVEPYNAI
jgi:hypothetical protein